MSLHSIINIVLLVSLLIYPIGAQMNKSIYRGRNKRLNSFLKMGRKIHPLIGSGLIISGAIHGYNMLNGNLQFHTGTLVILALALNGFVGFYYKKSRKKEVSLVHKGLGLLIFAAFFFHYFNPWYFV